MDSPLAGYPQYFGSKIVNIISHTGPTSYPIGGEEIDARPMAMSAFDDCGSFVVSQSGDYYVIPRFVSTVAKPTLLLQWFLTSSGAEVTDTTDLSGETVRLQLTGV